MSVKQPRGRPVHADVLTPAEWRVAEAVRHGLTNRAVAERQGVSPDAVKFHVANILSKLGFSSRAELRRWDGVRIDSNLANEPLTMDVTAQIGPIGQIARTVTNLDAAKAWYADVLGIKMIYAFDSLAFFDCGGTRLMLALGEPEASSILYFRVPDIRTAHRALLDRGAAFVSAPHMIHRHEDGTEEWMAFFNDNEGRPLAIMAQSAPPGEQS
jgi:DNA-binding CsgD family transcriptional regulator/catechol 2,3-dioxygenase-like lactoylglutathione lyase family enzyme